MTLSIQFITMLAMVLSGVYLGIVQDTFRRFSQYWTKKTVLRYILEILFWVLQTLIIFYVLFLVNAGELRLYIFLACLLGFSMYQALFKKLYLRLLEVLLSIGKHILHFIGRIFSILFLSPVKALFIFIIGIILFLFRLLIAIGKFVLKIVGFPFYLLGKLIYRLLPEKIIKLLHKFNSFYSTIRSTLKKGLKYVTFKRR